jgi:hypothetical protein
MRRTILLTSVRPFAAAFLSVGLACGLLNAPLVSAQPSQSPEVWAAVQGASFSVRQPAPWPLWIQVVEPTPLYSEGGGQVGMAEVGDRYRVVWQEEHWVQGVRESEPGAAPLWLALDSRVQATFE